MNPNQHEGGKGRTMRRIIRCLGLAVVLGGCQYTIFAEPEVAYKTPTTIGVRYVPLNLGLDKADKAMALIADHCAGRYEIRGRTMVGNTMVLDATCLR